MKLSDTIKSNKKSESLICVILGIGILAYNFFYLSHQLKSLEAGLVESITVWWGTAAMYELFGYWGALSVLPIVSVLCFVAGIRCWPDIDGLDESQSTINKTSSALEPDSRTQIPSWVGFLIILGLIVSTYIVVYIQEFSE
jgi:hypothetical protein